MISAYISAVTSVVCPSLGFKVCPYLLEFTPQSSQCCCFAQSSFQQNTMITINKDLLKFPVESQVPKLEIKTLKIF